ncbi:MAG: hypothetical protein IMZ53_07085 [Thermoplasmata archaeon]|nr:hypothetical protein [Thermoplasmata archaeon]MBE3140328.1 hypothetical protein [Thermoplasmata archaeon]
MSKNDDVKLLSLLPKEKIPEYIFMQLRNLWTADGLYFLGIEELYGTEVATKIDAQVWAVMGKIEARKLKEFLGITGNDIPSMMKALQYTTWALDLEDKEIMIKKDHAMIRNVRCRVQNTRVSKGLKEFGCKPVRFGFLKAFAKEFNPDIVVKCTVCPPDSHPENLWCQWEFTYKEK